MIRVELITSYFLIEVMKCVVKKVSSVYLFASCLPRPSVRSDVLLTEFDFL